MPYRLKTKHEAFTVVSEGPFEGRTFKHGEAYPEVPELMAHKFEEARPAQPAEAPKRKKGGGDK